MKFLFKYGKFLVNIINNEYEGIMCFKRAQNVYQNKVTKRATSKGVKNEQIVFGENTASAVIVVAATPSHYGSIVHANDEIEHLLGYQRSELINKNVSYLMPTLIAANHNRFIERYLNTGKARILDKQRQLFAITKCGHLQVVELLIKVHPHIRGQVLFVGLL